MEMEKAAASAVVVFGLWTCFPQLSIAEPPVFGWLFNWSRVFGCVFACHAFCSLLSHRLIASASRLWASLRLFWCFDFYTLMLPLLPEWLCSILFLTIITFRYLSGPLPPPHPAMPGRTHPLGCGAGISIGTLLPRFLWWFGKQIGIDWFYSAVGPSCANTTSDGNHASSVGRPCPVLGYLSDTQPEGRPNHWLENLTWSASPGKCAA